MTEYAAKITREGEFSPLVKGKLREEFVARNEYNTGLPVYAAPRARTWKSPVYNPESLALTAFREAVARGRTGAGAEIVCIGDSKTEGAGLSGAQANQTAQWAWPSQLRRILGASDGFIVANVTAGDTRWVVTDMARSTVERCCLVPSVTGSPSMKSARLTTTEAHTGLRLYARATAGAATTVTIDGKAASWAIPAQAGWAEYKAGGLTDTAHVIKVESTADFEVLGIVPEYSAPRLRITRAGRSSSSAAHWNTTTVDGLWASVMTSGATIPDALIVGLGTNDPTNTSAITAIYARAATLGIPVLCVAPGGLGGSLGYEAYGPARKAIYDAADTHGLPLVDMEKVVGDYSSAVAAGLLGDTLHENAMGYALEAEAVARTINLS